MKSFKVGDKVRVTAKNSQYEGKIGEVLYVYEDIIECSDFDNDVAVIPFGESDLELVDEKLEALISLAETLDRARLQANTIEATAPQGGVYGRISDALKETLGVYCREAGLLNSIAADIYSSLLDGNTVREAIAAVVK